MLARLRDNLLYKLLALGFAIALHYYVVAQENPSQSHTALVPLTARGVPGTLLFDSKAAPQIAINLTGPADVLNHLPDMAVVASVDLSRAHVGRNLPLPVHITLPPGESILTVADVQPRSVALTLTAREKRSIQITASDPGTPPLGFMYRPARITPRSAVVEGGAEAVASVQQVVANVATNGAVDSDCPLVALDAQGAQVSDVTVAPPAAHVLIGMARVPAGKTLIVNAALIGTLAYPYKVTGIEVSPQMVTVTGRPEILGQAYMIPTAPIDLSGATGDITRQVPCLPPPGLTISGSDQVTVTVHVAGQPADSVTGVPGATTPTDPKPQ